MKLKSFFASLWHDYKSFYRVVLLSGSLFGPLLFMPPWGFLLWAFLGFPSESDLI